MSAPLHTPTPWFVGCQNDSLFIVAGRAPALNNDYPWYDAPRVAVAKLYGQMEGDCLPVDADANAAFIVSAVNSHEALVKALRSAPIPGRGEEMMAFRDRQDRWLREAHGPALSLAKGEGDA